MNDSTQPPAVPATEPDLLLASLAFEAVDGDAAAEALARALATYAVLARGEAGCRNVDLCAAAGRPGRFVVIEKWASAEDHGRHLEGPVMAGLARDCRGVLARAPEVELLAPISAHDLR